METEIENFFSCPYCGSRISILLDLSFGQEYIEDCEICCKPISVRYSIEDGELNYFEALRSDD